VVIRTFPFALCAIALSLGAPAFGQEADGDGDDEDAPMRIEDHGSAAAGDGAAAKGAPSAPPKTGPAAPKLPPTQPSAARVAPPATLMTIHVHDAEPSAEGPPSPEQPRRAQPMPETDPDASAPQLDPGALALSEQELAMPRSPLADVELEGSLPWQRHGEIGASLAWVSRPFVRSAGATGLFGNARQTHYRPAVGLSLHMQWEVRPWLQVRPYFLMSTHEVDVPFGALSTTSPKSIRPDTVFQPIQARTFAFGGKVIPTWNLTSRVRAWLVAGCGYGRFGFNGVTLNEPGQKPVEVADREGVFVEFPLGLGGAYEILPGRAAFVFEATGAPVVGTSGTAHEAFQVVDEGGRLREIGAFGAVTSSFVQTFGLSILL
jgi:hypothetical protein